MHEKVGQLKLKILMTKKLQQGIYPQGRYFDNERSACFLFKEVTLIYIQM